MKKSLTAFLAEGGIIAALYTVLTLLSAVFGISSGVIQVRFSEMLTILPCFFSSAVPGLFVGCLLANLLTGAALWDIVFGSLATLLGAVGTRILRKKRYLACLPPIFSNTLIIPWVLSKVYGFPQSIPFLMVSIFLGELISCGILGQAFYMIIRRFRFLRTDR